jgi:hypothetical protein
MQKRTRAIVLTASMTVAGIALGATIASAANSSSPKPPALQNTSGRYVFACVNPGGGIDYLEFRAPLPHQCWFAGETLWYWDAVPLAGAGTTPPPTPTFSPTPTVSPTPTATATTTDAPVLANIETTALSYTSHATAEAITSALTVTDSDGAMITGATVSITGGFSATADTLSFTTANGISGSYDSATGVMTLSGSATAASYQAALRAVEFATTDTATSPAARTVSFTVTDADSETSNTATRTIDVTAAANLAADRPDRLAQRAQGGQHG